MRSVINRFVVCLAVVSFAAACGDTPTTPGGVSALTQTDLIVGSGAAAASGNSITVNYTGWLYDPARPDNKGLQFDTSTGRGPFTFILGTGAVIQGWDQGLVNLRVGGSRRLLVPPALAYGSSRNGPIPANSTLVFDVQLISIQ
ncbi:MAG: FKBP-type peptidyl-prolyl cis-trans isomerase [Vicinamibacterales bacterium]